jgi:hypothetical protein
MTGGDILKIQEYYKLPIKAVFNHLSYQLDGGIKQTK